MKKAVYAGTFDPFTNGHLEIVREAIKFFDEVIILCADNIKKKPTFDKFEMAKVIEQVMKDEDISNVQVIISSDLTADICTQYSAEYLVRGLRNTSDYMYEEEIAKFNQRINPDIKTIYFRALDDVVSSTVVKELYIRDKSIEDLVPKAVSNYMKSKM